MASARPVGPFTFDDETLIARILQSKDAERFTRLWAGKVDGFPSQSEADLALCRILAFWTGRRPDQIDRLFRRSGLFRAKWDDRHAADGSTYGQLTIAKAVANCDEVYTLGRRRSVSVIRVVVA